MKKMAAINFATFSASPCLARDKGQEGERRRRRKERKKIIKGENLNSFSDSMLSRVAARNQGILRLLQQRAANHKHQQRQSNASSFERQSDPINPRNCHRQLDSGHSCF
jgi:hypothetical protein